MRDERRPGLDGPGRMVKSREFGPQNFRIIGFAKGLCILIACVCPRRDAGAAARARRSPRAEPSTGVADGPQGGEAREGDASGGCRRCE